MTTGIDLRLQQLIALWKDASRASMREIPLLCGEILQVAAGDGFMGLDPNLLHRAARLSVKAEQRLAACVEIQSRTGSYSTHGALELSPRVVTAGWEG
jgi:hypothetical protein